MSLCCVMFDIRQWWPTRTAHEFLRCDMWCRTFFWKGHLIYILLQHWSVNKESKVWLSEGHRSTKSCLTQQAHLWTTQKSLRDNIELWLTVRPPPPGLICESLFTPNAFLRTPLRIPVIWRELITLIKIVLFHMIISPRQTSLSRQVFLISSLRKARDLRVTGQ